MKSQRARNQKHGQNIQALIDKSPPEWAQSDLYAVGGDGDGERKPNPRPGKNRTVQPAAGLFGQ
jgi:hypothetical protein